MARSSQQLLLWWLYRSYSGSYKQQCYLLQALCVAPADLVGGVRLTSLGGDMFTWPVTPLLNLLTWSDLQLLLGGPDEVAAWCRWQLCRPPAERPAGLTAELDTPRGRAELLLQPELQLRAVSEAVPGGRDWWQETDQEQAEKWAANYKPRTTSYQQCRQEMEWALSCDLELTLRRDLRELDGRTEAAAIQRRAATARLWRRRLEHLLSGDRLWTEYTAASTRWSDRWQLRQYAVTDSPTEGNTLRRRGQLTHRHTTPTHLTRT